MPRARGDLEPLPDHQSGGGHFLNNMIKHAGDLMIPITTRLSAEQIELTKKALERRRKKLKRRNMGLEQSLWVMEEIGHIEALLANQDAAV